MQKIIIKVGTNVITKTDGSLDLPILAQIVDQISQLQKRDIQVVLVSSGAVGAARAKIQLDKNSTKITRRQVLAAIGQIELLKQYQTLFESHGMLCAQVLATKDDFRDRTHYLNMKNCFNGLLQNKVVPIVNENDVVSVDELMFTDNDELAGLISSMVNSETLILLSNVDGVLDQSCKLVISEVEGIGKIKQCIRPTKSKFGRGGMMTKANMAQKLAEMGLTTFVANGKKKDIILDIMDGKKVGTKFIAQKGKASSLKRWIAHSEGHEKGTLTIDAGAEKVLKEKISSLLPIGIKQVEGEFKKGDLLRIKNEAGENIGIGLATYGSKTAKSYVGKKGKKALIHYDHLFLQKET
jgi:glutamate 5-kinase